MDEEVVVTPAKSPGGGTLISMEKVAAASPLRTNASPVTDGPYQGLVVSKGPPQGPPFDPVTPHVSRDFRVYVMNPFLEDDTHPLIREKRQLHFWFKEHVGGHSQSQAEGVVEKFYRDLMTDKESFPPDYVSYIKLVLKLVTECALIQKVDLEIRPLLPEADKKENSFVIRQNFSSNSANQSLASLMTHANNPTSPIKTEIEKPDLEKSATKSDIEKTKLSNTSTGKLAVHEQSTTKSKSPVLPRKPPGLAGKQKTPVPAKRSPVASPALGRNTTVQESGRASPTPKPRRSVQHPAGTDVTASAGKTDQSKADASNDDGPLSQADRCGTINRTESRKTITVPKAALMVQKDEPTSKAPKETDVDAPVHDSDNLSQTDRFKTISRTEQRKTITVTRSTSDVTPTPDTDVSRDPIDGGSNVAAEPKDDSLNQTDKYKTVSRTESRKTITVNPSALSRQTSSTPADSNTEEQEAETNEANLTQTDRYKTINRKEERKTISINQKTVQKQQETSQQVAPQQQQQQQQQQEAPVGTDEASLSQADKEGTIRRTERRKTLEIKPQVLAVQQAKSDVPEGGCSVPGHCSAPDVQDQKPATEPKKKHVLTKIGRMTICAMKKRNILGILEGAYPNITSNADILRISQYRPTEVKNILEDLRERELVRAHTVSVITGCDHWVRAQPREAQNKHETKVVQNMPRLPAEKQPRVAVITALYCEKTAMDALMTDKTTYVKYRLEGESILYTLGMIGSRPVVTTKLPTVDSSKSIGNTVTRLLASFSTIDHVILPGIAASVPSFHDPAKHSRLGDVIVSLASDSEKPSFVQVEEGNLINSWCATDSRLNDVIAALRKAQGSSGTFSRPWEVYLEEGLAYLENGDMLYKRPPPQSDKLYKLTSGGGRVLVGHPASPSYQEHERRAGLPVVHYGVVASQGADASVMTEEVVRKNNIRAFSSWVQPVMESLKRNRKTSFAVVCGVANYGDGSSKTNWEPYAALAAAAYTKALLLGLEDSNAKKISPTKDVQTSVAPTRSQIAVKSPPVAKPALPSTRPNAKSPVQNVPTQAAGRKEPGVPPPLPKQPPPQVDRQPPSLPKQPPPRPNHNAKKQQGQAALRRQTPEASNTPKEVRQIPQSTAPPPTQNQTAAGKTTPGKATPPPRPPSQPPNRRSGSVKITSV